MSQQKNLLELNVPVKEFDLSKKTCNKAGLKADDVIRVFIASVNKYYRLRPALLREFSPEKFSPVPVAETIYRFNKKSGKIERIGLTGDGAVLKLEESSPQKIEAEARSIQQALRDYFNHLGS